MKDQLKLPEGYTPMEYIEFRPKQKNLFVYGNFERFKEAMALANRINNLCKESVCQITTVQHPDNVIFCLVFSESIFEHVEFIKKEECQIWKTPTNVMYNTPVVYRFIDEQYVNDFWKKGILKLTTFSKCKELEDKNRKDDKEGQSELYGYDGSYTLQIGYGVGCNAIMLCTSLCSYYKNSDNKVYKKYIEIFDVNGLLFAIAEQLMEKGYSINEILFGPCFYRKK